MTSTEDELAALRAENARLRIRLAGQTADDTPVRRRGWGWAIPSAALIVVGALLAPVVVITTWAQREVTSTEAFVATFAPLARDRAVQTLVADRTVGAIEDQLDVAGLTGALFDGIRGLDLPPRAETALSALEAPATAGIQDLVSGTVDRFVASDQFADLWKQLLRTGHTQMVASLSGDRRAAVAIGADGSIGIQLGPVVAEVKERLVDRGLTFAERIPAVDRTIVIATSDAAVRAQTGYTLLQVSAVWLPWLLVACIAVGVVMARRRARALTLAAVGVALAMLATLAGIGIGRVFAVRALAPDLMPRNAARAVYDAVVAFAAHAAVAGAVLAACVALVAWFAGSSDTARRMRSLAVRGAGALRRRGDALGIGTGRVGVQLYRGRVVIRTLIALGAATVIVLGRPLEPALVVWTLVGALVLVAVLEVLQRPDGARGDAGVSPGTDDPVGSAAH
ncbi:MULTISPECIES: hypothetical protein [unclassified Curtobacterium]|uniref:hypothetical protein n=1 Tax=unclassified Curtobacterium TaxID=257496 RepID=UPI000F48D612|nr:MULTISPECIES: hypothetical protein [unclassified Curtobacterium]ROQ05997.1 hypothetical protein EDF41_2810 [Curtobacterium sp. PhB171]ROQ22856.1 hypothetical protein EDF40_2862 [Curtobacterium sp. PhB170]ROS34192.1 hypothetical protein EDF25_2633 [Curtobacterium sp. PhB131]ROS66791.1 hypothetical protein EDF30_2760 [Curtobacterium sp. PhB141]